MAKSNFFLMLGLSFDPPEERIDEIERAIKKRQQEWSRGAMDFKKGPVFREYMALLPEIQRVMLNPTLRKKEAEEALVIATNEIRNQLTIVAKRGFLYEEEVRYIAKKCQASVEMVEKVCQVPIRRENKEIMGLNRPGEYDHFQVFLVYLEALQKKDYYDYIRREKPYEKVRRLSTKELLLLANRMDKEQGKYTSTESTSEKLCAECRRTFASEEGRKSYDEYLQWKSIQAVYEQVEVATRFTKVLEKEQREEAIKLLCGICGERQRAEELLGYYLEKEHISSPKEIVSSPIEPPKVRVNASSKYRNKGEKECATRADYLYPKVVRIREEMSQLKYEEASQLLQEAIKQCGELPELMRIQDQLSSQRKKLYGFVSKVNEEMERKRFYSANQELIALRKEFPYYQDPQMEAKISRGLLSGKNFLEQAKAAKQAETVINACMDAFEACPDYPGVMELLAQYPPKLHGTIAVSVDSIHQCNYIHWNDNHKEAYIKYCVMRKKDARPFHRQDGTVIGTVDGNSFVDQDIVPGERYYYSVYAVRCNTYSNGLVSTNAVVNYAEVMNPTIAITGGKVCIGFGKVPTGARVEVYRKVGFVPAHPSEGERVENVTAKGVIDKEIEPGNLYGYRVYAVYQVNGEKQYSNGIPLRINGGLEGFEPASGRMGENNRIRVTYYFEVKKLFLYPYQVLLHVRPERYLKTMPPMLIVGGVKHAPLYKTGGKVIAMIPSQEVKEEITYAIKYKEIGELKYLNLFLQREEEDTQVVLSLKAGETLCIE